jgi:Ca2+-binding EF-hand superfamily protein
MCVARLLTCHRTPGVGLAVDDGNSVSRDEIAVFLDEQKRRNTDRERRQTYAKAGKDSKQATGELLAEFDTDQTGLLEPNEFSNLMRANAAMMRVEGLPATDSDVRQMFRRIDTGALSFAVCCQ